jgi:hypothetical protein
MNYVVPLAFWLKRRHQVGMMKSALAGAVITALLNTFGVSN